MKQPCNAHAHQQEEDEIIEGILHLPNVTRLEVIDHTGRVYVIRNAHVELSYQDDGKTLKIFANPKQ